MQIWKRRLLGLVAAGAGTAALLVPSAGAQIPPPPTMPPIDFPDFPEFPPFPTFTVPSTPPPPTMPPPTSSTTSPPPTMPPQTTTSLSPPPTMPPTTSVTIPNETEDLIEDAISRVEQFGEEFAQLVDELRALLDLF